MQWSRVAVLELMRKSTALAPKHRHPERQGPSSWSSPSMIVAESYDVYTAQLADERTNGISVKSSAIGIDPFRWVLTFSGLWSYRTSALQTGPYGSKFPVSPFNRPNAAFF